MSILKAIRGTFTLKELEDYLDYVETLVNDPKNPPFYISLYHAIILRIMSKHLNKDNNVEIFFKITKD